LPELDPDRTLHESPCSRCRAVIPVPLGESRLESGPWRLTWRCVACDRMSRVKVNEALLPMMLRLDRVGGMPVSKREVDRFASVNEVELDRAVREELL